MGKCKTRQEKLEGFDRVCREMIKDCAASALKHQNSTEFYLDRMSGELLGIYKAMLVLAESGAEEEALEKIFNRHNEEHYQVIFRVRAELKAGRRTNACSAGRRHERLCGDQRRADPGAAELPDGDPGVRDVFVRG
jgi:hypothetical protein